MHVQVITGRESFLAVLARIRKCSGEMNVFHMLSKIAPIIASLATESTSMSLGTIFLYVFIQLLVASCNK